MTLQSLPADALAAPAAAVRAAAAPAPRAAHVAHVARINRVLDHIDQHLGEPLDLEALAALAHFSPWHFHRVFQALTGETLADCVRRRRLEGAAQRLLQSPRRTALAVALEVGFASAEVFSRAFKAHFGHTPTAWRQGGWRGWVEARRAHLRKIHQDQRKAHQAVLAGFRQDPEHWPQGPVSLSLTAISMPIEFKTLPTFRLAYLRHTGPYGHSDITRAWERFGAWCAENGLMRPRRKMLGIALDNPVITRADQCRYDACVEVGADFQPGGDIGVQVLAARHYACSRFVGTGADVPAAWERLLASLPARGWQADHAPAVEYYAEDFVMDPETGVFNFELCLPVRADATGR